MEKSTRSYGIYLLIFCLLVFIVLSALVLVALSEKKNIKILRPRNERLRLVLTTWKTIRLGTGLRTSGDFRKALADNGFTLGHWSDDAIDKPAFLASISSKEREVGLVKITVAELGFKKGATRGDIYKRAFQLGLELSPAEVGPQLRLQYPDQPHGEWLMIAMEPIADSFGGWGVAEVGHGGHGGPGLWLCGDDSSSRYIWPSHVAWIFIKRKR